MIQILCLNWESLSPFYCTCICVCVVYAYVDASGWSIWQNVHKQNHRLTLSHQHTHSYPPSTLNCFLPWLSQESSPLAAAQHMGRLKSTSQAQAHTERERGKRETIALSQGTSSNNKPECRKGESNICKSMCASMCCVQCVNTGSFVDDIVSSDVITSNNHESRFTVSIFVG